VLFHLLKETMLKEVEEALENWDGKKSITWCSRMETLNTAWEDQRGIIMEYVLTFLGSCSGKCSQCSSVGSDVVIRCSQCGPGNLCGECDEAVHSMLPLHDREIFTHGYYRPVPSHQSILQDGVIKSVSKLISFTQQRFYIELDYLQ
jgi:hypothetical protein